MGRPALSFLADERMLVAVLSSAAVGEDISTMIVVPVLGRIVEANAYSARTVTLLEFALDCSGRT